MANSALVIGIDSYANPEWNLDSAVSDALAFAAWAVRYGKVDLAKLQLLLSPAAALPNPVSLPDGVGLVRFGAATSGAIVTAVQALGRTSGNRAFIYFAGHGCSAPGTKRDDFPEPVLIPSDVADLEIHYKLALGYSELQHPLLNSGPDEQLFFFDACRDFLLEDHERGVGNVIGPKRAEGALRAQFLLHAASPGERATERGTGIFGGTLLEGLKGVNALFFNPRLNKYELTFKGLTDFVKEEVAARIDRLIPLGSAKYVQKPQAIPSKTKLDTVILSYSPDEIAHCSVAVRVNPRGGREESRVEVYYYTPVREVKIDEACAGPPLELPALIQLRPGDYSVRVEPKTYDSWRDSISVPKITELDVELALSKPSIGKTAVSPPAKVLRFRSDDRSLPIIVNRPDTDTPVMGVQNVTIENPVNGIYRARLILPEGVGPELLVDFPKDTPTDGEAFKLQAPVPVMDVQQMNSVAAVGMIVPGMSYLQPSELIGPTFDAKVASLLAFAAYATYSYKNPSYMNKLRAFGVSPLPVLRPDSGWMTILLGCSGQQPAPKTGPQAFLAGSVVSVVNYMEEVHGRGIPMALSGFSAAAEFGCECPSGPKFVELRIPGFIDTRYATYVLPHRASVLVVVVNDDGTVDVQQYLLALQTEAAAPDPPDIRIIELAQRFYASSDRVPNHVIDQLLQAKFVDPIFGCLAGYLLIRQKQANRYIGTPTSGASADQIEPSPLRNMLKFFGSIPDSHVLAGLAEPEHRTEHFTNASRLGLPLFTEGFLALSDAENVDFDPFYRSMKHSLLTGSPWTAWTAREPVIPFEEGQIKNIPENWRVLETYRGQIEILAMGVGAILKREGTSTEVMGSCFLIDERHAVSSLRVADELAENGSGRVKPDLAVSVDFEAQSSSGSSTPVIASIRAVREAHLSVLTFDRDVAATRLPLVEKRDAAQVLDDVCLIGFPFKDSRNDPQVVAHAIEVGKPTKRLQPGIILEISDDRTTIDHSCLTMTGSGGSPVVQLKSGRVIGVHWGGWKKSYGRGRATALYAGSKWLQQL